MVYKMASIDKFAVALISIAPLANRNLLASITPHLLRFCEKYSINNKNRLAAFLSQCAHETGGFQKVLEAASGVAYEGSKVLGNVVPGDGVRFKGRGLLQITGRYNYGIISKNIFGDDRLLKTPSILEKPEFAVQSACVYWNLKTRNGKRMNQLADEAAWLEIGKAVNGVNKSGLPNGNDSRMVYLSKALKSVPSITATVGTAAGIVILGSIFNLFKL